MVSTGERILFEEMKTALVSSMIVESDATTREMITFLAVSTDGVIAAVHCKVILNENVKHGREHFYTLNIFENGTKTKSVFYDRCILSRNMMVLDIIWSIICGNPGRGAFDVIY